jgi:hypothetical protein
LEQPDDLQEKRNGLRTLGAVGWKASRPQGVIASPVRRPLLLERHEYELKRHEITPGHTSHKRSLRSSILTSSIYDNASDEVRYERRERAPAISV